MKRKTLFPLLVILAALLFLVILTIYLTLNFGDALFTGKEAEPETAFSFQTEPGIPASKEASGASQGVVQNNPLPPASHFCIWVGDSRTLGMMRAVRDDCVYIGAAGEGYDWFVSYGEEEMRAAISEHPDAPVIFNLGVNDYDNMELYLSRYVSLVEELSDTDFYFLAVTPIDPTAGLLITNEQIADFNSHLRETFPDSYIDGYTYLMSHEIVPIDGIHYDKEAYQMLHDFVINQLEILRQN